MYISLYKPHNKKKVGLILIPRGNWDTLAYSMLKPGNMFLLRVNMFVTEYFLLSEFIFLNPE